MAINDLIGPDKAMALKEYQETIPARMDVENLARQLEDNEVQLSEEQRKKLVDVYIEERARVPYPVPYDGIEPEAYGKSMMAWQDDYEKRVSAEASRILDSSQLARVQRNPAMAQGNAGAIHPRGRPRDDAFASRGPRRERDARSATVAPAMCVTSMSCHRAARRRTEEALIARRRWLRRAADPRSRRHLDVRDPGRRHRHGALADDRGRGVPRGRAAPPFGKQKFAAAMKPAAPHGSDAEDRRAQRNPGNPRGRRLGLHVERLNVEVTPPGGGRPTKRAGHTLSVLQKVDGRWQLARDANLLTPVEN